MTEFKIILRRYLVLTVGLILISISNGFAVTADTITNLSAKDIRNNGNGTDLQVYFDTAYDESTISKYRIIVVKTIDASTFDLTQANALPSGYYTVMNPLGGTVISVLGATAVDKDGDLVVNDVPYTVFVLSVADGIYADTNALSNPSNSVTLINIVSADIPTNIVATDIGNNGNGSDLQVSFDKAYDETTVSEYRIIVIKYGDIGIFNLELANNVSSANYLSITPSGANISTTLSSTATDKDGDLITNGALYLVYVLSMADGINATKNQLSTMSNELILRFPAGKVGNLTISDVEDYADGRDLQVSFDVPNDESTVLQYNIIVLKSADAATFDLEKAEQISSQNMTVKLVTGNDVVTTLYMLSTDKDGDTIDNSISYRVFVLSIADEFNAKDNSLSDVSNELTLLAAAKRVDNLLLKDIGENGNGSDLRVSFARPVDESAIVEYRVIVIKETDASSFDVTAANSIPASNYTYVSKGGGSFLSTLSSTAKDKDGNLIVNNIPYRVFILSIGDGVKATHNSLTKSPYDITLVKVSYAGSVSNLLVNDVGNNANGSDLNVAFEKAADETTIYEYRIIVVKSVDAASFIVNDANNVSPVNYTVVNKTGSDIINNLSSNAKDKDGDLIRNYIDYNVFVLSVADGVNAIYNILSVASNKIILTSNIFPATSVQAYDVNNNGNGNDLQVAFAKAIDEIGILEYHIIVLKTDDASTFTVDIANSVSSANYTRIIPTGSNIITTLSSNSTDKDGQSIADFISYKIFLLSVSDGSISSNNILSEASNEITLDENIGVPDDKNYEKIVVQCLGTDLYVSFHDYSTNSILSVFNVQGKELIKSTITKSNNKISLAGLDSGIYLINIAINGNLFTKKILLVR